MKKMTREDLRRSSEDATNRIQLLMPPGKYARFIAQKREWHRKFTQALALAVRSKTPTLVRQAFEVGYEVPYHYLDDSVEVTFRDMGADLVRKALKFAPCSKKDLDPLYLWERLDRQRHACLGAFTLASAYTLQAHDALAETISEVREFLHQHPEVLESDSDEMLAGALVLAENDILTEGPRA